MPSSPNSLPIPPRFPIEEGRPAVDPEPEGRGDWLRTALIFAGGLTAIGLAIAAQQHLLGLSRWSLALRLEVGDWAPWLPLCPLVLWICQRAPIDQRRWPWSVPLHLAASILFGIAASAGTSALQGALLPELQRLRVNAFTGGDPSRWLSLSSDRVRLSMAVLRLREAIPVYWALAALSHSWTYYRCSLARERHALQVESRLTEARLAALQAQLQPHFLFNALNTVSSLIHDEPARADEMVCELSELLRHVLESSSYREVSLADELTTVERYLAVQAIRFGEQMNVHQEIDPAALGASVPTLLLQPLVENAFVHGLDHLDRPGTVSLRAHKIGGQLLLEVKNDGPLVVASGPAVQERYGLGHTRARLQAMFGDRHRLICAPLQGGGFSVLVEIPFRAYPSPA